MPQVPLSTVQVQTTQASQQVQASPDAFGAGVGRGLQSVGQGLDALAQRAQQIQEENDAASAMEAYTRASDAAREFLRGEQGFLTREGREAFEGYDDAQARFDELSQEYRPESQGAREAFEQLWRSRREGALNTIATHAANQRRAYFENSRTAFQQEQLNTAIENYSNPEIFDESIARGVAAIRASGANGRRPADEINLEVAEYQSQAVRTGIAAALDSGNFAQAEALRDRHGDRLIGEDRATVDALIERGALTVRRQEATDEIFSRFGTDERSARRHIRENYEGDLEDSIIQDYNRRVGEVQISQTERREYVMQQAVAAVEAGMPVDELPPSQFLALNEGEREWLRRRQSGLPMSTDFEAYTNYANMDEASLRTVDLTEARRNLDDEDYNRVVGWVRRARDGEFDPDALDGVRSELAVVNETLIGMGIDRGADEWNRFHQNVERNRRALARREGREPNADETQAIVDSLAREVVFERPGLFNDVRGRIGTTGFGDAIPPEHQAAVLAAFPETRIPQSAAVGLYNRAIESYRERGVLDPSPDEIQEAVAWLREQGRENDR